MKDTYVVQTVSTVGNKIASVNRKQKSGSQRVHLNYALLLLAPVLIVYMLFFVFPFLFSAALSISDWNLVTKEFKISGLHNYVDIFSDSTMWLSFKNTLLFMLNMVPGSMLVGLGLALLVNAAGKRMRQVYRSLLYLPSITSLAVMGIVWKFLMSSTGYFNMVLELLGVGRVGWLTDPFFALLSISAISVWDISGYNMVLFTAALMGVNRTLYEAIDIDGGGWLSKFVHATLPQISPMLLFILITNVMSSFKSFATVNIMTQGGPNNATNIIGFRVWQEAFQFLNSGRANALSMMVFLILTVMVVILLKSMEHKVSYD